MKLSFNAAVVAALLSSAHAFQPAQRPSVKNTELNVFRRMSTPRIDGRTGQIRGEDIFQSQEQPFLADMPEDVDVDDLLAGLDNTIFQAYETMLKEVSQKANDDGSSTDGDSLEEGNDSGILDEKSTKTVEEEEEESEWLTLAHKLEEQAQFFVPPANDSQG